MMMFRTVKVAMTDLLGDQAQGRFRVVGYQRQSKGSTELIGNNRMVQVYYSSGMFPKSDRMRGDKAHEITLDIDMSASAAARADISILDSPTATEQQKSAALLAVREAAEMADIALDEIIDAVYQIVMDARNEEIGLPKGDVSSRWIDRIQKDTILERGDLVVKTANLKYSCRVQEQVGGDLGVEVEYPIYDSEIPVGDTVGAGVIVSQP